MSSPAATASAHDARAAALSALVPGLGQASRGLHRQAVTIFFVSAALLAAAAATWRAAGGGAGVFFLFLVVLPWWAIQSYDAFLPAGPGPVGLPRTLATIRARAHDIRYLGCSSSPR
jgi:hypothetical protein